MQYLFTKISLDQGFAKAIKFSANMFTTLVVRLPINPAGPAPHKQSPRLSPRDHRRSTQGRGIPFPVI